MVYRKPLEERAHDSLKTLWSGNADGKISSAKPIGLGPTRKGDGGSSDEELPIGWPWEDQDTLMVRSAGGQTFSFSKVPVAESAVIMHHPDGLDGVPLVRGIDWTYNSDNNTANIVNAPGRYLPGDHFTAIYPHIDAFVDVSDEFTVVCTTSGPYYEDFESMSGELHSEDLPGVAVAPSFDSEIFVENGMVSGAGYLNVGSGSLPPELQSALDSWNSISTLDLFLYFVEGSDEELYEEYLAIFGEEELREILMGSVRPSVSEVSGTLKASPGASGLGSTGFTINGLFSGYSVFIDIVLINIGLVTLRATSNMPGFTPVEVQVNEMFTFDISSSTGLLLIDGSIFLDLSTVYDRDLDTNTYLWSVQVGVSQGLYTQNIDELSWSYCLQTVE